MKSSEKTRPNILFIVTDQQRCDSLGCYGSGFLSTPALDGLAESGVLFERAYCTNPVCTPSRASILSGLHINRHGAWNVGTSLPDDVPLMTDHLREAGYRTHAIGKLHLQPHSASPEESVESMKAKSRYPDFRGPYYGFETVEIALGHPTYQLRAGHYEYWVRSEADEETQESARHFTWRGKETFPAAGVDWDIPMKYHPSRWAADRAIDFLENHDTDTPFFLYVGFPDPHHPHAVPREYTDKVDPARVPLPDFVPGELEDKPLHFRLAHTRELENHPMRGEYKSAGQGEGVEYAELTEEEIREGRAYYYTMVRMIDDEVGRILATLETHGLRDNTLIVFTTDHGELLGDHGLWMKGPFHYEPLIRVPLILSWPKGLPQGRCVTNLCSLVDLAPTLLRAAGGDALPDIDGFDLLSALKGEKDWPRQRALVLFEDDPKGIRAKTLVTHNRKLTMYEDCDEGELFDLENDPSERKNLWDDPSWKIEKEALCATCLEEAGRELRRASRVCYA